MRKFLSGLVAGILIASTPFVLAVTRVFFDVPGNTWYSQAVDSLSDKGVIEGYSNNTFRPANSATRAEVAVMLDKTVDYLENRMQLYEDQTNHFSFAYPIKYMKGVNGLWTPEGYASYMNNFGGVSINNLPAVEIRVENLNGRTLDQFIISRLNLNVNTLGATPEDRRIIVQNGLNINRNVRIGNNNFITVEDPGMFGVTKEFYTVRNSIVLMLGGTPKETYESDIRRMLATLRFD